MSDLRKVARLNPIRLDDPDVVTELACQNEKKDWIARKIGLPQIGSKLVNQYGIEWIVQSHAEAPTFDTLQRWRNQEIDPSKDLYPVVAPLNFSPRLWEFFHAIDRCTTKTFAILDTMPGHRKDGHVIGDNCIDTASNPATNFLFLDAARVHETIIAHEFGHAWVQYVDECEDLRVMEEASEPQKMRQVSFVQSFVLDLKVNDLLRRKGFDMSVIEDDQARTVAQLATSLEIGAGPKHPREEVFMALLVADAMVQRDNGRTNELARFDHSLATIRRNLAPLANLAEDMADAVRKHGYETRDGVIRSIDKCLLASFAHVGETFDLDKELTVVNPEEPNLDKFPNWLTQIPPKLKCKVGKHMARNDISSEWPHSMVPALTERAKVVFRSPDGQKQSQVLVDHRIGPPSRYIGMSEDYAEILEYKREYEERHQQFLSAMDPKSHIPKHIRDHDELVKRASAPYPVPNSGSLPSPLGRPYMAGLGRFLTAARLAEYLRGEEPYAYAMNNPITYVDPHGLSPCTPEQFVDCWRDGYSGCEVVAYTAGSCFGYSFDFTLVHCTGSRPGRDYQNCRALQAGCYASYNLTGSGWHYWQWLKFCDECYWKCKRSGIVGSISSGCDFWNHF